MNFCGGLHHAMPGNASGFCIYNDVGVAIRWLLDHGAQKVAYVDVDVHHGDGVERMFWDDPRVLTISLHESGRMLFPGTGFPGDTGGPDAEGTAVNVALPPGTGDRRGCGRSTPSCPPLLRSFAPDVLVTQHGCDSPLPGPPRAPGAVGRRASARRTRRCTPWRTRSAAGGGWRSVAVATSSSTSCRGPGPTSPRSRRTGRSRSTPRCPRRGGRMVRERFGRPGPTHMGDGVAEGGRVWWRSWEVGYDPEDAVDRAVMATREAVFPAHGLDIWFD